MLAHNYGKFPKDFDYSVDISELDEYDLENLQKLGIDEAWYWYAQGSYDGCGQILMRKGNMYDVHDMGHCSCYGPTDFKAFNNTYSSLDEIQQRCTIEAYKEIAPLVDMARGASR